MAGAPNVGKSTLFNRLTGSRREVGNWPGTTVEVGRGLMREGARVFEVVDLPGAYSLDAVSPDEALTRELLIEVAPDERPDVVIVVVDAAHLARSLMLVRQLRETDQPVLVAMTMSDIADQHGLTIDADRLGDLLGTPMIVLNPRQQSQQPAVAIALEQTLAARRPVPIQVAQGLDGLGLADARFAWIQEAIAPSVTRRTNVKQRFSDRFDRVALSSITGPPLFLGTMWLVFALTTNVAAPLQDALDWLFTGPITTGTVQLLTVVGLDDTWVRGLLVDGFIAGVGMLLTFVPLMTIMFALLALLEDSGYLARAAVVTDRLMRMIGLPGRAFLPLIVGFGCNVPAISATRILPNARHRILTMLLVPFTSCSARLTVYVLVASTFFPASAGTVVFAMYLISIAFVVLVGLLLRTTLWRSLEGEALIIDLPPYQRPILSMCVGITWLRLRGFLRTASGIIVATVAAVWFLQAIPAVSGYSFGQVPVQDSVYAQVSKTIAPVFAPAGFGSWETTSALIVGFVAKEAVISSWAQTYASENPHAQQQPDSLGQAISADFEQNSGGHTTAAVWAFLIFLLAYTPCVATLAAQRKEMGLRWTGFGIAMQLSIAWIVAVIVFQIGSRI